MKEPSDAADLDAGVSSEEAVPSVVIVVVTTDPGPDLDEALGSFEAQDYANLSLLVIDAGSETSLATRVADIAPDAFFHRLQTNPGYTAAANQALGLVSDASFFLFCHDDVALDGHCVSALVEELYRSNAGIVGPKMVEWEDRRRLQSVGRGSDRFGVQVELVEPHEFDQEQYDGVRDVFVAPSGAQLIRADLFRILDGFDGGIIGPNEDLDICWRAHVAGARVVIVPAAVARHRNEHEQDVGVDHHRRLLARNRLRTLLVTSTRWSLVRLLPIAVALLLLEGTYAFVAGRRKQAAGAFGAIGANLAQFAEIRARRANVHEIRQVADSEVRALQVGGSARISGFFRDQFGAGQDRLAGIVGSVRKGLTDDDDSSGRVAAALVAFVIVFLLFGSRHLITRGVSIVGQIPNLPSSGVLLGEWLGGWRSAGLGGPGAAPSAFAVLGLLQLLFFWGPGVLDLLLVIGPLVIGAYGAWRLVQPLGSPRASGASTVAYLANPLPVALISAGRWHGLVAYAAAPFLVGSALRIQGLAPFGSRGGERGPGVADRSSPIRILRYGLSVTLVVTFAPSGIVVGVLILAALFIATFVIARPSGAPALVVAAVAAVVTPVALHAPWALDIADRFSWAWLIGPSSPEQTFDSLADLIRFAPGPFAPTLLVFGLLIAASAGLVIGRSARFDTAARGWVLAASFWLLIWVEHRGWSPVALPAADVLLAPAAAGIALAVGASVRAVEVDGPRRAQTMRRLATVGTATALVVGGLGLARSSLDGRWDLPSEGYGSFTTLLADQYDGPSRVLWLADPRVAPLDVQQSDGGTYFAVTDGGFPSVLASYVPGDYGMNAEIGDRLDLAAAGETANLGRLLGPYGIDLVIVVPQLAPSPYEGPTFVPGGNIAPILDRQLDLERVAGTIDLAVYRNDASRGPVVRLDDIGTAFDASPRAQLDSDLTPGERVAADRTYPSAWESPTPLTGETLVAVPASGWSAGSDALDVFASDAGTLIVQPAPRASNPVLDVGFDTPLSRRLALVLQVGLVAFGVVLGQTRREDQA